MDFTAEELANLPFLTPADGEEPAIELDPDGWESIEDKILDEQTQNWLQLH